MSVIWLAKRPGGKKKMPRTEDARRQKIEQFLLYVFVPIPHGQQQLKSVLRKVLPLHTGLASCITPQQPHGPPCTPAPQAGWSQPCSFAGPTGAASHSRAL